MFQLGVQQIVNLSEKPCIICDWFIRKKQCHCDKVALCIPFLNSLVFASDNGSVLFD